ncbi:hypothetical protein FRC09_017833, partial [Ceratobasidium sp. 395]
MTDAELDDLLSLLVTERENFFSLCALLPDAPGWAPLLFVLWVRIAPECGPSNWPAISSLKRLYQLNDLLGRYCLAATRDSMLNSDITYTIARWMLYKLLPVAGTPGFYPSSTDIAKLPQMKEVAVSRLNFPPPPGPGMKYIIAMNPIDVDISTVLLEFITGYQLQTLKPYLLEDVHVRMTQAAFARLWVEIQSDRIFAGLVGRYNVYKLAYAVFRNAALYVWGMKPEWSRDRYDSTIMIKRLQREAVTYSVVLQEAGLVDLIGRIILLLILPDAFSPNKDHEASLQDIGEGWFHMSGYIEHVPGSLRAFFEEAITECFSEDYATWLKVLHFLQIQDRSTPNCKRYFIRCLAIWETLRQMVGFTTKTDQRCAYTGCINPVGLHRVGPL